jgi:predicted nucleic-acid-binding Zn-ribbon protein
MSSGWTCTKCGARRIRTVIIDAAPTTDRSRAKGVSSKCPACGYAELVIPPESEERIISVRYTPS